MPNINYQVLYIIGGANGRQRREVASLQPLGHNRLRRAASIPAKNVNERDYLKTLFASHNAQNGTNMHFLSLGKFDYFTFIILLDFILR